MSPSYIKRAALGENAEWWALDMDTDLRTLTLGILTYLAIVAIVVFDRRRQPSHQLALLSYEFPQN